MEKHISKKFFGCVLALSAGFVLAACDPVSAVPTNYNNPIIASTDGEISLDGNNLGTLYDSITSERNSKIVNDILEQIAEKKFGTFAELMEANETEAKRDAYITAHADFFGSDDKKLERFNAFVEDIGTRISEYFYNEITSGSYNDDLGRFNEKKLYNAHRYELYDLSEVAEDQFHTFFVDKEITKETAIGYLNFEAYAVAEAGKRGYIQEKVYPDILRNKLVEDYIYQNNPSSLGRAYARELSYIKVSYEGESVNVSKMMEEFAKANIQAETGKEEIDFEIVANAVKGFENFGATSQFVNAVVAKDGTGSGDVYDLLKATYGEATDENSIKVDFSIDDADDYTFKSSEADITLIPEGRYYKETKLGKIVEDYKKAIKAEADGRFPTEEGKSALDSFTGDGKTKQYGLLQKLVSLAKEDYTTDGWYVKNGGVSELPSAIRDRLFNIRVANSLDAKEGDTNALVDENAAEKMGAYEYVDGDKTKDKLTRLPYMRKIYGKNVILPAKSLSYDKDNFNYIYHDVDGKAFYICQVLEAPSTAKLNESSEAYTAIEKENISRQVAKILGTKDSYIKDAYTEYLNKYEFTFFDSALYDYFKAEYPDLDQFED